VVENYFDHTIDQKNRRVFSVWCQGMALLQQEDSPQSGTTPVEATTEPEPPDNTKRESYFDTEKDIREGEHKCKHGPDEHPKLKTARGVLLRV
jgi:hypothetical protein